MVGMMGFMGENQPRIVHIFEGNSLLGRPITEEQAPQRSYNVRGKQYDTVSYLSVTTIDLKPGWDVQVHATSKCAGRCP